jgi:single-stranded-DNA-specific exonuclease
LLDANADLFIKYGGHSQAAGLTIKAANIPLLQERLNQNQIASVQPILNVDMRVKLATVSFPTVKKLEKYSFFTGTYLFENLIVKSKQLLANKHLKLMVLERDQLFEAIIFNNQEYYYHLEVGDIVSIVGGLAINQWKSKESLQVMIKDLKCDDFQVLDLRHLPDDAPPLINNKVETILIDDDYLKKQPQMEFQPTVVKPSTVIVGPLKCLPNIAKAVSKDHLGQIYKVIHSMTECDSQKLIQLVGGSEWTMASAIQIFSELDLIQCDQGKILLLPTKQKKNLEESPTFRRLLKVKQTYEFILDSPYPTIKAYFTKLTEVTQ